MQDSAQRPSETCHPNQTCDRREDKLNVCVVWDAAGSIDGNVGLEFDGRFGSIVD